ncbi:MAG: protein TolR [Alphaproteobacteria bacterium]|nr:protein TolR [Alphaproteobacteria bacterium]
MGASLNGSGRSGASGYKSRYRPMAEINVTPFVDVMLVLLIVFMVTAPLLTVGVPVDLPETKAASINDDIEPIVVSVRDDGALYLQETQIDLGAIGPRLVAIQEARGVDADALRVFVRGDQAIHYGRVMEVMGAVNSAGFRRVALLAKLPDIAPDAQ